MTKPNLCPHELPVDAYCGECELKGQLDQLWGWAKSGKSGGFYLMDIENVDQFTEHVTALVKKREAEAYNAGALEAMRQLVALVKDKYGIELATDTDFKRTEDAVAKLFRTKENQS